MTTIKFTLPDISVEHRETRTFADGVKVTVEVHEPFEIVKGKVGA